MASSDPHITIDDPDDDDFDWDAAVREIDIACENSKPSTSTAYVDPFRTPSVASSDALHHNCSSPFAADKRMNGAPRQSTLDRFIGRAGPRIELQTRAVAIGGQGNIDDNGGMSFVEIDVEAAKTWIYPVNVPLRDYQFAITKTALFTNTLVALPTGLGKTLIAAVVMYNYFRWFPEGKIVFTAPSRPLVVQQIEACHNIVGIPQELTIDMTGQICPTKRADLWKTKRVFFVTPQVLEKDIQSGTCLVKYLVCLVIDEAHRALGNYSYCVAVRELMAIPVQLRLLALTATPGSKQQTIQHVINNLLISSLEYRNESDPDVSPYVHNRKIELIQVAMGEEASQINYLLLNVIRTYAARLTTMGILLNRDYQALSPSDLLNSRDKFRQAPPPGIPPVKYGEVERCFGALITLYHIRKLLSSHGITPAYEMLEEKLQQGSFASLMSRNEDIQKAKLLMQQNLSRGTPNPKLSKMLEVLIDHFNTNGRQSSRVIIFSNFRGSVRDIMVALSKVGDTVKAAQFVGQSSGKSLKGQSQKVQQAVLEKFRSGGYNVIVATSIGEEGLDIMEVDLVICFDANVSPLRMVQRMGRTGRKHDGRVVVLACEGSEMKSYIHKQANSKAVKKHMRNGGIASFNFHSSPRMIPHIFKPEVQFIELSIEKFVPRGKRVKDDHFTETQRYQETLTTEEANLISKYFKNSENQWKPSLIAFPHFQTFPSSVHKVTHSYRTGMLIDSMQLLQGHVFSSTKDEEEASSFQQMDAEPVGQKTNDEKDSRSREYPDVNTERWAASATKTKGITDNHDLLDFQNGNRPAHSCLFSSDFVAVDTLGNVSILLVPSFNVMEASCTISVEHPNCLKTDNERSAISSETTKLNETPAKDTSEQPLSLNISVKTETRLHFGLHKPNWQNGHVDAAQKSMEITYVGEMPDETDSPSCTPDVMEVKDPSVLADDVMETELSPRLTNYIESGVVPESPVGGAASDANVRSEFHETDILETPKRANISTGFLSTSRSPNSVKFQKAILDTLVREGKKSDSPATDRNDSIVTERWACRSPVSVVPPETTPSVCCSRDWCFTPRDDPGSIKQRQKLKRLRRIGEGDGHAYLKYQNPVLPFGVQSNQIRGKKNCYKNGRAFIEEEAEVSSGADTSGEDEDDTGDDDSYDDSFINDRINPTAGSPQAVTSSIDMMAIYRRSLLSQSPIAWQPNSTGEESKVRSRKRKLGVKERGSLPAVNLEELLIDTEEAGKEEKGEESDLFSDDQFYEGIDLDEVEAQATSLLKHKSEELSRCEQENVNVVPMEDAQTMGCLGSPSFDLRL